jgi:hypothetical protein
LTPSNVQLTAIKKSENMENVYVFRFAEMRGNQTMAIFKLNKDIFKFEKAIVSDGIERVN